MTAETRLQQTVTSPAIQEDNYVMQEFLLQLYYSYCVLVTSCHNLTNSVQLSPTLEANGRRGCQGTHCRLWNLRGRTHSQKHAIGHYAELLEASLRPGV